MNVNDIHIAIVSSWDEEEIVALYRAGGWWEDSFDPAGIPALIRGSFAFVVAADTKTGQAVGMGRALSDGVSDAYIQDLVVLPGTGGETWEPQSPPCLLRDAGMRASPGLPSLPSQAQKNSISLWDLPGWRGMFP